MNKPAILGGSVAFPEGLRLVRPTAPRWEDLRESYEAMCETGRFSNFGPYTIEYEEIFAERFDVRHCISLSNLSTGLMYMPGAAGINGGEIIVPSFTFGATAQSMTAAGLNVVFADIDEQTMTLDPESVEAAISSRTVAVCATHTFGMPCDATALESICAKNGLALFFDAAHAIGSYHQGKAVGGFGLAEGFSTSVTKVITTLGEGGFICTNDDKFAEQVRLFRNWAHSGDYNPKRATICAKLPELSAAAGILEANKLDFYLADRAKTAQRLSAAMDQIEGISYPTPRAGDVCAHKEFPITIDPDSFGIDSVMLARALEKEGVGSRKYFSPCLHQTDLYKDIEAKNRVPLDRSALISDRILSIPFYTHMDSRDVDKLADVMKSIHEAAPAIRAQESI